MPVVRWEDYRNTMQEGEQQVIIQLVGPDMTGKTEIAKALAERLDIPYFKASSEHQTYLKGKNLFIEQLRHADPRMADFLKQSGYDVVFDRGYPCEYVYSRVMGRETDKDAIFHVDRAYAKLGTKIVVTYRESYDGIVDDIDKRIDQGILEQLEQAYRGFAELTACEIMFLPVDDEDLDREVDDIILWLQKSSLKIPQTKTQWRKMRHDALDALAKGND
jgi:ATP-dependent Lon protease